jgi:hypothetical protein
MAIGLIKEGRQCAFKFGDEVGRLLLELHVPLVVFGVHG